MSEVRIWHEEQKTQSCKEYYLIVVDGEESISCILKYDAEKKLVQVEPYTPPDINYTIHDGCNHENDVCALDYPDSWEAQDVALADGHNYALQNLLHLEKQVKQQRIANALVRDKQTVEEENND